MSSYLFPKYASWKTVIMEKLYMRRTCIRADKIICISYATKKDLINTFSINKNKVRVIYNGDTPYKKESKININKTNEIFGKYNISRGYFLFLGSISPRKNIETILRAYEVYREEGFKDKLVIAGKIAWKNKKINRLIKNSKYKDDIIVAGYVDEVEKEVLYRNADALLFPSLYEGFGFPILEAMSVGTIVITSNISSMPEVAKNAALYLNNLFDYKELADLMIKAVNMDKIQKDNMIELGYKRVALFNRRTTAKLTYELFMEWNTA
jgi:glycosyltransferase involved in cell wall biosynthesis